MKNPLVTMPLCAGVLFCVTAAIAGRCLPELSLTKELQFCIHKSSHLKSVSTLHISPECQVLDFSQNELTEVNNFAFVNLAHLLFLDLSHNNISVLNAESFSGLTQLSCLDLSYNSLNLTYIAYPKNLFRPLWNLKLLDVGNNIISNDLLEYPDVTFQDLYSLEELHLDMFDLVQFGTGFSHLVSLKTLSASRQCDTYKLYNDMFVAFENITLTSLNLEWCGPRHLEELILKPLRFLTEINLSNNIAGLRNVIKTLDALKGGNLSVINFANVNSDSATLEDQSLTIDMFKTFQDFCISSLDLSDNLIVRFDYRVLLQFRHPECLQVVKLNNLFLSPHGLFVASFVALRFRNIKVIEFAGSMLRKKLTKRPQVSTHGPAKNSTIYIPPTLEAINASGIRLSCNHINRKVFFIGAQSLHTLNLSHADLIKCVNRKVAFGLESVQRADISGVPLQELTSEFFKSFPNLTDLVARQTSLTTVFDNDEFVFRELKRLRYLDIGDSELTFLPSNLLQNQPDLQKLDLSYNKLTMIPDMVLSLNNLKELDLRYNAITDISPQHRTALDDFVRKHGKLTLSLEGNPLTCNCYTYDFVEWIWMSEVTFDRKGNYTCAMDDGKFLPLLSLRSSLKDRKIACVSTFWVKFSAVGSVLLLFAVLVSVIVYRYRVPIKYWYHTLRGQNESQTPTRFRYDALVAYCHADRDWVLDLLYPQLVDPEHGHGYKLCVYDRNFLPGVPIEDSIMAAINRSYKIIMVISPAFVRSVWCRYELQLARMKMVQEGREDVIIPVILEDVPVSSMPKSLLNLWNTSVFLIWPTSVLERRHFWTNMTTALGPVRIGESPDGGADTEMITTCAGRRHDEDNDDERDGDEEILLL